MTTAEQESGQFMRVAERAPTLFAMTDEMVQVLCLLDENEGELSDDLEQRLALVETALAQKVESYVAVVRSLQHIATARKAEADRLKARAATADKAADWLLNRLLVHMKSVSRDRYETALFTVAIRQNPPKVEVLEDMMVPDEFKRTVVTTTVDKRAILEHTRTTGEVVPGTAVVRGERVAIS